ncbi:2-amino-1-hydroxyethylphosphonate dioxygenase (glycine-forming)-like [Watersipora subatra]|uniref:2-amino-1-hydroxyethylphosphonate dioxygenase (glycine-forming)-like n=1 Tax=Watersipora subatra TaxID=2589382 RepID=UPI00355B24F1
MHSACTADTTYDFPNLKRCLSKQTLMTVGFMRCHFYIRWFRSIEEVTNELIGLYKDMGGNDYIGEAVTQAQHALQTYELAKNSGYGREVTLGAFFHDIGHLIGEKRGLKRMVTEGCIIGTHKHDKEGQAYLESLGFKGHTSNIVGMHVQAKRYLVTAIPGYYDKLSAASKMTLVHQGGPMSQEEVAAFDKHTLKEVVLEMRLWDEKAKDPTKYSTAEEVQAGLQEISNLLSARQSA